MEELSLATKDFSDKSLIGEGKFGPVYKGMLNDGMLVAIKKRAGTPSQEFVEELLVSLCLNGDCICGFSGSLDQPTKDSRYSLSSSQRLFSTSHRPTTTRLFIPNASNRKKSIPNKSPPSPKSTPEICRVENILVEGRIEGSVVHFHRPRTIAIDSLGAISASGMGMYFAFT
ncbi:LRR receptor kinase SERK2 [Camellia lanceoleosa]|uniref:LRR receptor kinase SERK2 n=1 Tax=Camellia lanceoleosa TaxID=1840588 RepID=A0ACC0I1X9_9ERIC|nr:LRR receptor kinase SERK2 [Camellia lanceoleosa]